MAIDRKDLEPFVNFDMLDKMEASYATLSEADRIAYDADLKAYRDLRGQLEYAEEKGRRQRGGKIVEFKRSEILIHKKKLQR